MPPPPPPPPPPRGPLEPADALAGADSDTRPVFVISVAAELAGLHPQTLRTYDRLGLVRPGRAVGRGRRYSPRDVARLREVARLSQDEGISLPGIRRILDLENQVAALQARLAEVQAELAAAGTTADARVAAAHLSHRRDLVRWSPPPPTSVVLWRRPHR